jgi:hypothetical protein
LNKLVPLPTLSGSEYAQPVNYKEKQAVITLNQLLAKENQNWIVVQTKTQRRWQLV